MCLKDACSTINNRFNLHFHRLRAKAWQSLFCFLVQRTKIRWTTSRYVRNRPPPSIMEGVGEIFAWISVATWRLLCNCETDWSAPAETSAFSVHLLNQQRIRKTEIYNGHLCIAGGANTKRVINGNNYSIDYSKLHWLKHYSKYSIVNDCWGHNLKVHRR